MAYDEVSQLRGTTAQIANYTGYPAQLVQNTETGKMGVMQGDTAGNIKYLANEEQLTPLATKEELKPLAKDADVLKLIAQSLTPEQKAQVVKNLEGTFLPLTGDGGSTVSIGELNVGSIHHLGGGTYLDIFGGEAHKKGGQLTIYANTDDTYPGGFALTSYSDKTDYSYSLRGENNGSLAWDNHPVEVLALRSSTEDQGLVRYSSGLQIAWYKRDVTINNATQPWLFTFLAPFAYKPVVTCQAKSGWGVDAFMGLEDIQSTQCGGYYQHKNSNASGGILATLNCIAIGWA